MSSDYWSKQKHLDFLMGPRAKYRASQIKETPRLFLFVGVSILYNPNLVLGFQTFSYGSFYSSQ